MPTSASFRRTEHARTLHGFTLLEMLIVLVMLTAVTALVAPRLMRTYDAVAGSGERAEVRRQLERLPVQARALYAPMVFEREDPALATLLDLPDGWTVAPEDAFRVEATGLCPVGARLRVAGRGVVETWRLQPPGCEVRDAP